MDLEHAFWRTRVPENTRSQEHSVLENTCSQNTAFSEHSLKTSADIKFPRSQNTALSEHCVPGTLRSREHAFSRTRVLENTRSENMRSPATKLAGDAGLAGLASRQRPRHRQVHRSHKPRSDTSLASQGLARCASQALQRCRHVAAENKRCSLRNPRRGWPPRIRRRHQSSP